MSKVWTNKQICPYIWTNYGRILDKSSERRKIVQNKIGFRHILGTICMFGHFLDMLWTNHGVWTHLGHIMDMFYQNVSKKCPSPYRAPAPLARSIRLNPRNLPYYICISLTPLPPQCRGHLNMAPYLDPLHC